MSEFIDNYSRRQAALKRMIHELHAGQSVETVKAEFAAALGGVDATEIAALEQALIDEGMPQMEIKRLCDVHVAAFRDTLDAQSRPDAAAGHPVAILRAENAKAAEVLGALSTALSAGHWDEARARLEELQAYEAHYSREENVLFPYLERHGFAGPSAVMWAIHDDIRAGWRELAGLLVLAAQPPGVPPAARIREVFTPLAQAVREMFYKEENILFPAAERLLSQEEWAAIAIQAQELAAAPGPGRGRTAAPAPAFRPDPALELTARAATAMSPISSRGGEATGIAGLIPLQVGALSAQQIALLLTHLPVDVTFVDENDEVRFFSAARERIFPRHPAIIGRKVQQCHPPASVHKVQRILDDFREGRRDVAEFWIQMRGRFIHIRYFAMRDEEGRYRGTLEVSQDVTSIRALEGERRLLDEGE